MPIRFRIDSDAAQARLARLGLRVEILEQATRSVPKGRVFTHTPAAGSLVALGTTVTLNVSAGPPQADSARITAITTRASAHVVRFEWLAAPEGAFPSSTRRAPLRCPR